MVKAFTFALVTIATAIATVSAADPVGQFKRLGACPDLGCVFPPDSAEFIAGSFFDVRVEVHAENDAKPNTNYSLTIQKISKSHDAHDNKHGNKPKVVDFSRFSKVKPSAQESWDFSYSKDAAAYWKGMDGDKTAATPVHVASTAWRKVAIKEPGTYKVTLNYNNGKKTEATWVVNPVSKRKAKNVILFIGDGMTTAMITAARLISKPHTNGKYSKHMNMDQFPVLGHIMTQSLDSLITDSANSASAYNTGHKSSAGALGVYPDSSANPFDDPKQELIAELLRRRSKKAGGRGGVGIVTTAEVQDATPAAVYAHTRIRDEKATITGGVSLNGTDYYAAYSKEHGYKVVNDKTALLNYKGKDPLLGIFHSTHMDVWLDRNVYKENLAKSASDPTGTGKPALNQPNLDQMVLKGLEVLDKRSRKEGWFLMAEAASVDKMMHPLDYDRALADLLELDSTIGKTKEWLKKHGLDKDTLILVTADHAHSFDVYGSVDTQYFNSFSSTEEDEKKNSVGTYENSGWPSYVDADGDGFPDKWDVRYTLAAGTAGFPAHREDFQVSINGTNIPAVAKSKTSGNGILKTGTMSTFEQVGVHSLQDVPIFASGPGSNLFAGIQDNTEVFHKIAEVLGLGDHE
ncbi:hypothetical protein BG000_001264 [Podila horticola]|nr:hypothetical protein BG000_001264 [Podila horticola]